MNKKSEQRKIQVMDEFRIKVAASDTHYYLNNTYC